MTSTAHADLPAMVVFESVGKRFGTHPVLSGLSFTIARNEFVLLSGAAGTGKTTVLRLIAAIDTPTEGSISVAGERLDRLKVRALAHLRRSIGVVAQSPVLLHDRSIQDNVALPVLVSGLGKSEARQRALSALQRVGLDPGAAAARPAELSGSARQLAALARAIVNRPALLLVDEPAAHVDVDTAHSIMQLLEQFSGAGVTIVMVSHEESVARPGRLRVLRLERALAEPA